MAESIKRDLAPRDNSAMQDEAMPIVRVENLVKDFPLGRGAFARGSMRALNDVSFELRAGQALAIVGESGSGKSTVARILSLLYPKTSGSLFYDGREISDYRGNEIKRYRQNVQMIFQDPYGSLNPVHTIYHHLARPLLIHREVTNKTELKQRIFALLEQVGLSPAPETAGKYPYELSGGQRQRVCIARTLAIGARVVLADEPTSALDVSIRLGILNLMETMKTEQQVAFMYITHDIATARYFAERTAVMYVGHMVEWGESEDVIGNPQHPYTRLLIAAVPDPSKRGQTDCSGQKEKKDIPLWRPDSRGCPFAGRCAHALEQCAEKMPGVTRLADNHFARCFLLEKVD